jgi:hypothetical protein
MNSEGAGVQSQHGRALHRDKGYSLLSLPLAPLCSSCLVRPICDIFISLLASPHPSHQYLLPSSCLRVLHPNISEKALSSYVRRLGPREVAMCDHMWNSLNSKGYSVFSDGFYHANMLEKVLNNIVTLQAAHGTLLQQCH